MSGEIFGRKNELAALARFLDAVGRGPVALGLEGEIGIGKSSLWQAGLAVAKERSYRVLVSRPVEAETKLPFASLGDLFEGVPDDALASLPDPQERALSIALLRSEAEGRRFPQRAVALGVLGALRALAADAPVLVAIDDLQWLDPSSARVLEFALRRLEQERIGALLALRAGSGEGTLLDLERTFPEGRLHRVVVGPLGIEAIGQLLRQRLDAEFSHPDLLKLREASGGNPYFALEFARALAHEGLPVAAGDAIPVPQSLRDLVRDRLERLPAGVREFALIASALSHPSIDLVETAMGPKARATHLTKASEAGVVELDGDTIRFTHPLLSSVLYSESSPDRRRRLHRRLAEVLDDPEERARHLALATDQPNEGVATELEAAAHLARARGAPEAAAELAERACRLTPHELREDVARRSIDAADYHVESGNTPRARALLEEALASSPRGVSRAKALIPLAWTVVAAQGHREAKRLFREARAEADGDPRLEIESEQGLSWCEHHDGDLPTAAGHARSALEMAEALGDPALLATALADLGFLEFLMGHGMPRRMMERALALEQPATGRAGGISRPSWISGRMLEWTGDLEAARSTLETLRARALEVGDERHASLPLDSLSRVELRAGDWQQALQYAEAGHEAALQSGQESERLFVLNTRGLVTAHLALVEPARADAEEALELAERLHSKSAVFESLYVLGFLEFSVGNLEEAALVFDRLARDVPAAGFAEPGLNWRFQADEIETLVGLGRLEEAEARLAYLEEQGRTLDRAWALATAARCRGLLLAASGDTSGALRAIDQALTEHDRLGEPFELGRTQLVRGIIARRDKKKKPARTALQKALEIFEHLGAALWAEKTRTELERVGGRPPMPSGLTPTEQRIADLVADGRTNREVADALFVSPKTVEWNLTKIYQKLGVHSRGQLSSLIMSQRNA